MNHPVSLPPGRWSQDGSACYLDYLGRPVLFVGRIEATADERKRFLQFRWDASANKWLSGGIPEPRPLLNLQKIASDTGAIIIVCEGEKAAQAAQRMFPDAIATTWPGGAQAWRKVDFSPLHGRNVVLWPDSDHPGVTCMRGIADILAPRVESLLLIPADPDGDGRDAADAEREGEDGADILQSALPWSDDLPAEPAQPSPSKPGLGLLDLLKIDTGDDPDALLGYQKRWLARGGFAMLHGASGIGKSSLVAQLSVGWCLGETAMGITVRHPLKVLVVQAENDAGDLAEQVKGTVEAMGLMDRAAEIDERLRYVTEAGVSGAGVRDLLDPICEAYRPDLIILDPLFSFLGGDASDQANVSTFLRSIWMPFLAKHRAMGLLVHHVNKPPSNGQRRTAYAGAGSAELENAPRASLVLLPGDEPGTATLTAQKRGMRIGWQDSAGRPVTQMPLKQSHGRIYWEVDQMAMDGSIRDGKDARKQAAAEGAQELADQVLDFVVKEAGNGKMTYRRILDRFGIGGSRANAAVDLLRKAGLMLPGSFEPTEKGTEKVLEIGGF